MPSEFGRKFYDLYRVHVEQGIPAERLNLSEEHKRCVGIVDDLYEHYRHNPAMNVLDFLRNKYNITDYSRLYKLNKALNYVVGMMSAGLRDMQRFKANYYAERMARIGDQTGDWKPMDKAVAHMTKINALDQPDPPEDVESQLPKMAYMLTTDPGQVKKGSVRHTPEQIAAFFKHYGVEPDVWQKQMDSGPTTADNYDEHGNLIHPARRKAAEAEDAEYEELEKQWEQELKEESEE